MGKIAALGAGIKAPIICAAIENVVEATHRLGALPPWSVVASFWQPVLGDDRPTSGAFDRWGYFGLPA